MLKNPEIELAWDFVNNTDRNIFLTGKAGTGKTTFLHKLKNESLKRLVVVAPTGVAAINAGGITVHSFFQLPFGPLLPGNGGFKNQSFSKKFSANKINIIKSLDLLVIDEISMVRADLLDAIEEVLQRFRDKKKPFGGVQLLMIGDLHQLSPVIKEDEWQLLKQYYTTGFFFGSKAFQNSNSLSIELKHIYRQESVHFIKILNEIRTDSLSRESIAELDSRYQSDFSSGNDDGYITLTTHNYRADNINSRELGKLKEKCFVYDAEIEGKFPEYMYPTHPELELKTGAQVMFIKNDSSGERRYFNGKIGKVVALENNKVVVQCPEDDFQIVATPEIWEHVNYTIEPASKEIKEQKIGSFAQIPLRLAWAITIHKSQGLTFEKIIVDAQDAFAHGQTYVALSRCRTLEGIVLSTPISGRSIINNMEVASFNKVAEENQPDREVLKTSQKEYQLNLLDEIFNFYSFLAPIGRIVDIYYKNKNNIQGNLLEKITLIKEKGITELLKINTQFRAQLEDLSRTEIPETNATLQERFKKAVPYFEKHTNTFIKNVLNKLKFSTDNNTIKAELEKQFELLEDMLALKLYCFGGLKNGFTTSEYLKLRAEGVLQKTKEPKRRRSDFPISKAHPRLYEELLALRRRFSEEEDVAPYQVFTQKALAEMCDSLPTTLKQLKTISDIGKVRLQKYGSAIVDVINDYCVEEDIEKGLQGAVPPQKSSSQQISFQLFKSGWSIAEIAKERKLTRSTIEGHLSNYLANGELKITDVMPNEKYIELKNLMETVSFDGFGDLKRKIDEKFSYGDLRMVAKAMEFDKNIEENPTVSRPGPPQQSRQSF